MTSPKIKRNSIDKIQYLKRVKSENRELIKEKIEEEKDDFELKWIKNEEISVLIKQLEA